jgi:hypothetical protein
MAWTNPHGQKSIGYFTTFTDYPGTTSGLLSCVVLEWRLRMNGNLPIFVRIFGKYLSWWPSTSCCDIWLTSSARGKREEKPTSIIHGNAIDLNTLDIKPTNIFFSSGNGDITPNSTGEIESLVG